MLIYYDIPILKYMQPHAVPRKSKKAVWLPKISVETLQALTQRKSLYTASLMASSQDLLLSIHEENWWDTDHRSTIANIKIHCQAL